MRPGFFTLCLRQRKAGMEKLTLTMIAQFSNGEIHKGTERVEVCGISTDSRRAATGHLFVALKGERFNGHDFLDEAAQRGASGAMVGRSKIRKRPATAGLIPM